MSATFAQPRVERMAYGCLLAGMLLVLALLPDWRVELGLSVFGAVALTLFIRCSVATSVAGIFAAVTVVLLRTDPSNLPLEYRLVALASVLVCAIPILTWRHREDTFPILGTFCVVQGIYIYVGALIAQPSIPFQAAYTLPIRELGITTTFLYVAVLVAAGMGARRLRPIFPAVRRWTSRVRNPSSPSTAFTRSTLLFVVGIAVVRLLPAGVASHLGAIPQVVGSGRVVGIGIAVVLWLRGSLTPIQRMVVVLGVLVDAFSGTNGSFALYSAAGAAIAGMIVLLVRRPPLAAWVLLLLIPLVLVVNIGKSEARAVLVKPGGSLGASRLLLSDAFNAVIHPHAGELTVSAERFDYPIETLGYVAYHVPRDYPYWNKESYTFLPLLLVPRAVAPFKPPTSLGNEFGREYGLLAPNDFVTSENTPLQVEAWTNFGFEGLIVIALILGALLGIADGLFDSRTLDGIALGTLLAFQAVTGIESGISGWAIAIPMVLIFIPVTRWALGPADKLRASDD
jgi:hypothetical protein